MAFTNCAGVPRSAPRSCFVKPAPVEAPRQVIGFDLSPKGEKSGALRPNLDHDDEVVMIVNPRSKSSNPCLATNPKSNTATSPRSALQQLLLRPIEPQSEPASSSPAANQKNVTNGPLLIQPACKPQAIMNDGRCSISSAGAVSAIKCGARNDERSRRVMENTIHELPRKSERNNNESSWKIEDQLQYELPPCREKSKKSSWMKEVMINGEHPYSQHEKSSNVEIRWKQQASISIPDQSKKGSLFMLGASSPAADYTNVYGAARYNAHNMDMDFLNSCYLCKRGLGQGHDVFMYNGDKGFCSMECRYQQIVIDERRERHAPPVIRSGASPVYYQSYMSTARAAAAAATASAIAITTNRQINRPSFMNPAAAA